MSDAPAETRDRRAPLPEAVPEQVVVEVRDAGQRHELLRVPAVDLVGCAAGPALVGTVAADARRSRPRCGGTTRRVRRRAQRAARGGRALAKRAVPRTASAREERGAAFGRAVRRQEVRSFGAQNDAREWTMTAAFDLEWAQSEQGAVPDPLGSCVAISIGCTG
jgi:hypothetical protein